MQVPAPTSDALGYEPTQSKLAAAASWLAARSEGT